MNSMGHDRAFVVTSWPLIAEAEVESQAFVGFVGYNVAMWKALLQVFWFSLSVPFYHFYTHSSFIELSSHPLPPTMYNVFLPVLQFSPVSTIPPLLNTHPSIYHPRCIMFFSQHFSFPLSVSFHHCSILIHPSTTHTV